MANGREGSIASAIFWMFILSILLFWLPVVGSFIAGIVGGRKAGSILSAIIAVLLPGVILAIIVFFLAASLIGIPLIGPVAALGGWALSFGQFFPLLFGAIIGGAMGVRR